MGYVTATGTSAIAIRPTRLQGRSRIGCSGILGVVCGVSLGCAGSGGGPPAAMAIRVGGAVRFCGL